jgi:transcriptional antiterminator NusG
MSDEELGPDESAGEVVTSDEAVSDDEAQQPVSGEAEAAPASTKLWYVLKVQSNREKSIRENLLRRMKRESLEHFFGEIRIPTEKVVETKGGKKKVVERKLYPGYLMIQMELNDETWYLVRETGGVGDFTGAARKPMPMEPHEIARMLGGGTPEEVEKAKEPAKVKIDVTSGDKVKIKEGGFEGFEGVVDTVDDANGEVTVLIEIFGRSTPVKLEHWQVETV